MRNRLFLPLISAVFLISTSAQAELELYGYGSLLYNKFQTFKTTNSTDPIYKEQIDLSELAFEGEYEVDDKTEIEFEIEIEHGGVGNAMEFEPLEEFGEFETEVEKGGEITLSEVYYAKQLGDQYKLFVGKFPLFISLGSVLGNPNVNKAVEASTLESRMIPAGWNETGFQIQYMNSYLTARAALVNGLNSEFFRTYNWVGGGYQRHFETVNATDKAILVSLELGSLEEGRGLAYSVYKGDTTDNRHKIGKLTSPSNVEIQSLMGAWNWNNIEFLGQYIVGTLQNSDLVVTANNGLGGLAKPKSFGPLGHKATTSVLQIAYNINDKLAVYAKNEHVNTFVEVEGNVSKYPRYNVKLNAGGLFWKIDTASFMKAEYSEEKTALETLPMTHAFKLNFGFEFGS